MEARARWCGSALALRRGSVLPLIGGSPQGPGWAPPADWLPGIGRWHAEVEADVGDRRAAASFLATWLAGAPVLAIGLPWVVGGALARPAADGVRVRRASSGRIDGYAVATDDVRSETDPAVVAQVLAAATRPLVERLCDELPVSPPALWGGVADALGGYALWFARVAGRDQRGMWGSVDALLDALVRHTGSRHRPRLFPVEWSGGCDHFNARGTCCLHYRTASAPAGDGGLCASCPLVDDGRRRDRLVAHLQAQR